mmetsp:Transcript_28978/g.60597  ORF Transcript_28978/g.60597 Transcript_28978/m.60597 type:complete len:217 (+) Transcript_28978:822-1472(+)
MPTANVVRLVQILVPIPKNLAMPIWTPLYRAAPVMDRRPPLARTVVAVLLEMDFVWMAIAVPNGDIAALPRPTVSIAVHAEMGRLGTGFVRTGVCAALHPDIVGPVKNTVVAQMLRVVPHHLRSFPRLLLLWLPQFRAQWKIRASLLSLETGNLVPPRPKWQSIRTFLFLLPLAIRGRRRRTIAVQHVKSTHLPFATTSPTNSSFKIGKQQGRKSF